MNASYVAVLNVGMETWVAAMTRACLQGGLYIAAVWLLCRLLPRLPAAMRAWLWWLVCLKMCLYFVPLPTLNLPLLPASRSASAAGAFGTEPQRPVGRMIAPKSIPTVAALPTEMPAFALKPASVPVGTDFTVLLLVLWGGGVCLRAGWIVRQAARTRRLLQQAQPIEEETVRAAAEEMGRRLKLRRLPALLASDAAAGPMIVGPARPVIVLPRPMLASLSISELRMVLAHEWTHLRRGDLRLTLLPALAQTLFFFYPPVWLAVREYRLACESACDAETLRLTGANAGDYGTMLLKFASANPRAGVLALGASSGFRNLERRLTMLQRIAPISSRSVRLSLALLFSVGTVCIVPWRLSAQNVGPTPAPVTPSAAPMVNKTHAEPSRKRFVKAALRRIPVVRVVAASRDRNLPTRVKPQRTVKIASLLAAATDFAGASETKQTVSAPKPTITPAAKSEPQLAPSQTDHIRLDIGETTIYAALKELFRAAGVSYRIDQDAARIARQGKVTLSIVDMPFRTALEMILQSSRALPTALTYRFENGYYVILPVTPPSGRRQTAPATTYHVHRLPDFPPTP